MRMVKVHPRKAELRKERAKRHCWTSKIRDSQHKLKEENATRRNGISSQKDKHEKEKAALKEEIATLPDRCAKQERPITKEMRPEIERLKNEEQLLRNIAKPKFGFRRSDPIW